MERNQLPSACKRCGLDCIVIGGSQNIVQSCNKQFRVDKFDGGEIE